MKTTYAVTTLGSIIALGLVLTTGCEMPIDHHGHLTASGPLTSITDAVAHDAIAMTDDGDPVPADVYGEGIVLSTPGDNRIAMLVTGSATFDHAQVRGLRLNVRQTASGSITGSGEVTFRSPLTGQEHTTSFVASCIKPVTGWGRTNYGVTLVLEDPFAPYGSMQYTHAAVSITPEGHTAGVVLNTRDFCGGTVLRDQMENRLSGNIAVLFPGT